MKKYQKVLVMLLVFTLMSSIVLTGCSSNEPTKTSEEAETPATETPATETPEETKKPAEVINLQLGHEQPTDHPYHYGAVKFAELVAEKTNGGVNIEIFPGGSMGKAAALTESISMGTIDFAEVFSILLEKYSPDFGVLTLPYCFSSWEHAWKVLDGEIGDELNATTEDKGIKVLTYFTNGIANVNTIKPIKTPAEIKGIKLRVQEGPTYVALGNALETVTTPMSYGEVYSALQMGTIDGQLQTINNIKVMKFNEVAPYYTQLNMCFNTQPLIMSKETYDKLPAEYQKAIEEAADEAAILQRKYHAEQTATDMELMKKEGMEIYDLTEEELAEWHKAVEPVYDQFPDLKDRYEKIQTLK